MKKTLLLILIIVAGCALGVTGASAALYQFMPTTQVESFNGNQAVSWDGGLWHNMISDPTDTNFVIQGANLVGGTLEIFTGWPSAGASDYTAIAADLFLYSAGTVWAVRLYDGGGELGYLYQNPGYQTSQDFFASQTNLIYGGAYDEANPKPVPVWATSSLVVDGNKMPVIVKVTWGNGEVDVDLSNLLSLGFDIDHFSFLYASATCANSVLTGHVPLPASLLLLGSGLVGLALLGLGRKEGKTGGNPP